VVSWPEFVPSGILRRLAGAEVDFVVVGGVAVVLQAIPRFTQDLDICYAPDQENLDALGRVLVELDTKLAGIEESVPFVPDGRTLRRTQILCLETSEGPLDLLANPAGAPPYAKLRERAEPMDVGGFTILVASIDDMISMKEAAGRGQDIVDVESLQIARRRRGGGGQRSRARTRARGARARRAPRRARPR
jgi:hypothetical protein